MLAFDARCGVGLCPPDPALARSMRGSITVVIVVALAVAVLQIGPGCSPRASRIRRYGTQRVESSLAGVHLPADGAL